MFDFYEYSQLEASYVSWDHSGLCVCVLQVVIALYVLLGLGVVSLA